MNRRENRRASPTSVSPKETLEHCLLVDVLVQMSKVLLDLRQVPETEAVEVEARPPDTNDPSSLTESGEE